MPRVVTAPVSARCEAACRPATCPCSGSDTSLHAPQTIRLLLVVRLLAWGMRPVSIRCVPVCWVTCDDGGAQERARKEPDLCTCKHARNQHANQYAPCADFLPSWGRDSLREPSMT